MKNKKTLLGLLLIVVMLLSTALFVSCKKEENPDTGKGEIYYLYENGEFNKSNFIQLKDGKWSDDDNENGTYVVSGTSITIYVEMMGEKEEYAKGTLKDGVLTLTIMGTEITYCKEGKTPSVTPSTPDEPQKDDGHSIISAAEGEIRGKTVTLCVFSEDGVYDLRNKFTVSEGAGWRAFTSPDCTQPTELTKRTVNIEYGWNDIYVMVENQTTYENSVYNVKIYRAPISGMELTENDTYRISEGIDFPEVILPDYYNGKKVTEIGNGAFSECKSMKTLVIGNCVTAIGANAFGECTLLTDVVLPDSVTDVGEYAFASCTNLVSVTIGRQVAHIGYYAFSECEKLVEVINNSALKIEKGIDDDDLGRVGYYALDVRAGEKSAIDRRDGCLFYWHGDTVYLLGYTGDRTALTLPDDYDGSAYEIYKFAFYRCDTIESVIIGNSVKRIWEEAFYYCDNLRGVGIPDQITDIGEDAFYRCPITEATLPSCAISAISVKKLETVVITSGDIEKEAFYYAENLTSVTLGTGVKTIGSYAFAGSKKLKTLIIKDKVTEIGASAFSDCVISDIYITDIAMWCRISGVENLMESGSEKTLYLNGEAITDLVIPDGITTIGTSTFYGVKNLISVTVPTSVISIGKFAFRNCNNLKSITLPFVGASRTAKNGYDQVFGYIFGYRTASSGVGSGGTNQYERYYYYIPSSIRTVIISDGATAVAEKAFYRCGNLVNVVLPDSIETIGTSAFEYCDNLESIRLPFIGASKTADKGYDQVFGYIFGYDTTKQSDKTFSGATYQWYSFGTYYHYYIPSSLRKIFLSDSVTSIGGSAFKNCSGLTSITIPDSVTSIDNAAFNGCKNLNYNECDNALYLGNENNPYVALIDVKSTDITSCVINENCKIVCYHAFRGCSGLTSITIPDSVTSIDDGAFYACSKLTSVTIPSSVTSIGKETFYSCSGLTSITIPDSVTSIGDSAFYRCSGLTSITIPDSVTSIGSSAFNGCSGLTSITIPDSVTSIGYRAFWGCSGLTSITIPDSVTSIGDAAFRSCSKLTSITIPDSVTSIGESAFSGCSGLTSITIPDSVTSIGDYAFSDCSKLTSVTIPSSVTSIGKETFYRCSGLTSVTIPDSVTFIGDHAFWYCSKLTSVIIPDSVTSIGDYAFYECSGLTSVIIPDSVISIGYEAFYWCIGLSEIRFNGTISRWNAISKGSNWNFNVPSSCKVICTDGEISL